MTRRRLILLLILALALALRLYGIRFESYHPDEKNVLGMAQKMVNQGTLEPTKMYYGTLTIYLQALALLAARTLREWMGLRPGLPPGDALTIARLLSTMASVVTVALTAQLVRHALRARSLQSALVAERGPATIAREGDAPASAPAQDAPASAPAQDAPASAPGVNAGATGSEREVTVSIAWWLAPLIMAVSFLSVQCAHYSTVDSLMTALATGAILMAFKAYDGGQRRHFMLAGLLAGLATATKYTGGLSCLPLAAIPLLTRQRPRPWKSTILGLICVGIGFSVGMPYAFIQPRKFFGALRYESNHYRTGGETIFAMGPDTPWWNIKFLFYTALGPGLLLMALFGIAWLVGRWKRDRLPLPDLRRVALFLIYPTLVYLFVSRYVARFDRNILPLIPFLSISAAAYAEYAWRGISQRSRTLAAALIAPALLLALAYPLMRDIVFGYQLQQPHTKRQIANWKKTLPRGVKVKTHERMQKESLKRLQAQGYDYIVMSSHSYEPVAAHPDRYPELYPKYREIFAKCPVEKVFSNPWFDSDFFAPHHLLNSATVNVYHGPTLMVLRIPPGDPADRTAAGNEGEDLAGSPSQTSGSARPGAENGRSKRDPGREPGGEDEPSGEEAPADD